jgi:hypothetical protein
MKVLSEISLALKIQGFSWKFRFMVVKRLIVPLLLGSDFFTKKGLVLHMPKLRCHFHFALDNRTVFSDTQLSSFALQAVTQSVESAKSFFKLEHLLSAPC